MTESWKVIDDFPAYEVSSLGRIRKTSIGHADRLGTWHVSLADGEGRYAHPRLDELVAAAFLERPAGKTRLRFKDDDKSNCRADNLEWI